MHAATSGAIDQNISRPSCNNRGLAGLGAGCGWEGHNRQYPSSQTLIR